MNEKEIIDDMRRITMLTGEISTIHTQNLQKWPYIVFDGISEVKIDYDISKNTTQSQGEGFVTFKLTVDPMAENKMLKIRCEELVSWVRYMFWKEIAVDILFNDVKQYSDSMSKEVREPIIKTEKPLIEAIRELKDGPKQD